QRSVRQPHRLFVALPLEVGPPPLRLESQTIELAILRGELLALLLGAAANLGPQPAGTTVTRESLELRGLGPGEQRQPTLLLGRIELGEHVPQRSALPHLLAPLLGPHRVVLAIGIVRTERCGQALL